MPLAPLRTCIWYDGQALEAAKFYVKLFGGKMEEALVAPADFPSGKAGQLLTVRCTFLGQGFELLDGGPAFKPNNAISFIVECDTQAEIDRYWKGLQAGGGSPQACGWCTDRFGVSWQVVPTMLYDALSHKDKARAERAMNEMLKQEKLDIAKIEAAMGKGRSASSKKPAAAKPAGAKKGTTKSKATSKKR